ncbi:MAG: phage tail protein, partial [Fusobacteriaceae bacterium]|nr:phage tail protein [Fusobacteriaceae bacterium]
MPGGFTHGTRSSEVETQIKGFLAVKNPVVIIGTAPINQGNLENVNKITLIQTTTDAAVEFGGAANLPGFTISEALYVGLQIFPTRPIIVVNVLDPNEHSVTENLEDIPVLNKTINLSRVGIIKESLEVKNAANSIAIDDYTATFKTDGTLNIKLAETLNVTAVDVEYVYLDPSLVTEADIIGSINPDTLERKGLELIHDIFPKYSMIPSYVITPRFNSNALRAILDTKASIINDKWGSMSIFDIPDDTAYGSAIE